jgi:hypothetical protein
MDWTDSLNDPADAVDTIEGTGDAVRIRGWRDADIRILQDGKRAQGQHGPLSPVHLLPGLWILINRPEHGDLLVILVDGESVSGCHRPAILHVVR